MFLSKSKGVALLAALSLLISCIAWFPAPAAAAAIDVFDDADYTLGQPITLTFDDSSSHIASGSTIIVGNLRSTSDPAGFSINLNETVPGTEIFSATASAEKSTNAGLKEIGVSPGDTLYFSCTYGDDTAVAVSVSLAYSSATFTEAAADNGSIQNSLTLTLTNDSFAVPGGPMTSGTHYQAANVPAGLSLVITGTSATTATVSLTGTASSHAAANSIANMQITFLNSAFAWGQASRVTNYTRSDLAVSFSSTASPPTFVSAETNGNGSIVYVTFSKAMSNPSGKQAQFVVTDGAANTVSSVALKSGDSATYALTLNRNIDEGDAVTVAYNAGNVTAADSTALATFAAKTVSNRVDSEPSATYSGITDTDDGPEGSDKVYLEITVENSNQAGLEGYEEDDFEVIIDNDDEELDFNDSEFGSFSDEGDGVYSVTFYGDEPDTTYELDLWVDGVKIENDYEVTTPEEDDDEEENQRTYTLTSREKTISFYGLEILIPEDAWDYSDTEMDISHTSSHPTSSLRNGQKFASDIYYITKDRSGYFEDDITLTISFEDYNIDEDEYTISIYWYSSSSGEWEELDNVDVNWYTEEVSGDVDHFTKFALIADEISGTHTSNNTSNNTTTNNNNDIWTGTTNNQTTGSNLIWDISGHWAESSIRALVDAGIVQGEPDGSFKPGKLVNRAEFSVLLVRAFGLSGSGSLNYTDTRNHWARDYIATAVENGVMQGYSDSYFGPDDLITREQMATAIANTIVLSSPGNGLNFNDTGDISSWAYNAVAACTSAGIINGDQNNFFRPLDYASKAEAATIIFRAWE